MDELTTKIKEINGRAIGLYTAYQFQQALPLYEESRALSQRLPPDSPLRAVVLHNLGVCQSHVSVGLYDEGAAALREALRIRTMTSSTMTDVTQTLTVLGKCLRLQKKFVEGEEKLQQARDIQEEMNVTDGSDVAGTLHEMGVCLTEQGKYTEAIPYLQQVLQMYKKTVGFQHPNTAAASCWLGVCKGHMKQYDDCFKLLQEALSIRRSVFGHSRVEVAWVLYWRGLFLNRVSKHLDAELDLKEACKIMLCNKLPHTKELMDNIERELRVCRQHRGKKKSFSADEYSSWQTGFIAAASRLSAANRKKDNLTVSPYTALRVDFMRSKSHNSSSTSTRVSSSSRSRPASWHGACQEVTDYFSRLSPQQKNRFFLSSHGEIGVERQDGSLTLPSTQRTYQLKLKSTSNVIEDPHWSGGTLQMMAIEKVIPFNAVIGCEGGSCGSSDIAVTVPPSAVSTPTPFSTHIHLSSHVIPPIGDAEDKVVVSPVVHLSPSRVQFNEPVLLSFPSVVSSTEVPSGSDWWLELKMSDSPHDEDPKEWYTALEFNTKTRQVICHSPSVKFDPETGIVSLDHFCWLCWLGQVLGIPSLASRSVCYAVFGKQLHRHKWTISTHIIHGRNIVYDDMVQALKEQGYIPLTPPTAAIVGLCGQIELKVQCDGPWALCMGPAVAHVPTKRIWRSPLNWASYFTVTVHDPTESTDCIECRIHASFTGEWIEIATPATLLVSHPLELKGLQPIRISLPKKDLSRLSTSSITPSSTPPVITVNKNQFTFNHSKGLAFGSSAQISFEQVGFPELEAGVVEVPRLQVSQDSEQTAESGGGVSLDRNSVIEPDCIVVGVETALFIHLCPSEDKDNASSISMDGCLVQFISCAQEEHMKFEQRHAERVTDRLLRVLSPGWPMPDRLLVRILTLNKKQLATAFIDVEGIY